MALGGGNNHEAKISYLTTHSDGLVRDCRRRSSVLNVVQFSTTVLSLRLPRKLSNVTTVFVRSARESLNLILRRSK